MDQSNRTGEQRERGEASAFWKKPYESPELVEWGQILEVTHGLKSGFEDFPAGGGTQGV